jgi:hypothetical protein
LEHIVPHKPRLCDAFGNIIGTADERFAEIFGELIPHTDNHVIRGQVILHRGDFVDGGHMLGCARARRSIRDVYKPLHL